MSTLTGNDVMGLMEAYQAVYAPQELTEEQVWEEVEEWVNTLIEEGYDLSDYTWEEMFEAYIEEQVPSMDQMVKKGFENQKFKQGFSKSATQLLGEPGKKPIVPKKLDPKPDPKPDPTPDPNRNRNLAANTPAPRPSGTTPAAKPAPKPAGSAMDQWAKANPKLAAAKAERDRTRGTSSTDNPLMGDMKSRLPAAAPKAAPSNTLSNTVAAASKPAAFNPTPAGTSRPSGFGVPTAPLAAKLSASTSPTGGTPPKLTPKQVKMNMEMEYDAYDIVLEHLLDEGYADTEESALVIMTNMSEEWKQSIVDDENLQEKLKKGTKGKISFTTGKDSNYDQAMTETNPTTGRQKGTSPMYKAMGAHGRARSAQANAERSGDTEAARSNERRRGKLAHLVYNKTGRIIDRADND